MTPAGTSNELDVQNEWEENTHHTHTLRTKRERKWYKKYSEKATSPKKKRKKCGYLGTYLHIERLLLLLNEESMKTKTKQNKTNVTPEKDVMTSANQTPGGHKFPPLVASQQGRANQHEPACFGLLSSPWSFPSRSGIPLQAVVQPWFFLQRSILP